MTLESILWTGRPSQAINLTSYVFGTIGTIAGVIMALYIPWMWILATLPPFHMLYRFLLIRGQEYVLTRERLMMTYGILSKEVNQLELYRVKDYQSRKSMIQRLCGVSDLTMATSDRTHPVVVLEWITDEPEVREMLRTIVEDLRARRGVREFD